MTSVRQSDKKSTGGWAQGVGITLEWMIGQGLSYEMVFELRPTGKKTANHMKSRDSHQDRKASCVWEE